MIVSLTDLQQICPEIPDSPVAVRKLLDESGIEVHSIEIDDSDCAIDVELLANRGDHRGVWGIALELAARLGASAQFPPTAGITFEVAETTSRFEATYDFATIVGAGNGLEVVALAKDVSHELGQPLHVYDRDKLNGQLRVRFSRQGEVVNLIGYSEPISLPADLLVVADEVKIVALAGVLGCIDSSPDQGTSNFLVESACYDPVRVRKSASALRISTVASQRFERGSDRAMVYSALQRLAHLVKLKEVGETHAEGLSHVSVPDLRQTISASHSGAEKLLGLSISQSDWARGLERLGFVEVETERWLPPHARVWDVLEAADLYEEYARLVGFDNIPEHMPNAGKGVPETSSQIGRRVAASLLNAHGFFEVVTSGTYGEKSFSAIKQHLAGSSPLLDHVHTAYAQASEDALLRNNIFVNICSAIDENSRVSEPDIRLYEFATIFTPDDSKKLGVDEKNVLWGLATGGRLARTWQNAEEVFGPHHMVGIVEQIARALGQDWSIQHMDDDHIYADLLHPFQRGVVVNTSTNQAIGVVGSVHPGLVKSQNQNGKYPVMFQIASEILVPEAHQSREVSGLAPVVRMLDFVLHSVPADEVRQHIRRSGPTWLREVYVDDVYQIPDSGFDVLSVTFGLSFEPDASRTATEINSTLEALRTSTVQFFGAERVAVRGA